MKSLKWMILKYFFLTLKEKIVPQNICAYSFGSANTKHFFYFEKKNTFFSGGGVDNCINNG